MVASSLKNRCPLGTVIISDNIPFSYGYDFHTGSISFADPVLDWGKSLIPEYGTEGVSREIMEVFHFCPVGVLPKLIKKFPNRAPEIGKGDQKDTTWYQVKVSRRQCL